MEIVHVCRNHGNTTHLSSLVVVVSFADMWVCFFITSYISITINRPLFFVGVNMTWSDSPIKRLSVWLKLGMNDASTVPLINNIQVSFLLSRSICLRRGPSSVMNVMILSWFEKQKENAIVIWIWMLTSRSSFLGFSNENIPYAITSSLLLGRHIWKKESSLFFWLSNKIDPSLAFAWVRLICVLVAAAERVMEPPWAALLFSQLFLLIFYRWDVVSIGKEQSDEWESTEISARLIVL